LGDKNIMLLHNHGTLTVGRTCAEAFIRMYFIERACTMQVRTRMLGGAAQDYPVAPDVIEKNAALARSGGLSSLANKLVWPALLRKLDRLDPGFRA
jgi:ribulose-5-phosphate 4-epimerase/fuculose-1-phosphate aldolase